MSLLILLGMISFADEPATSPPPSSLTKDQIIAGIEHRFSLMSSMSVTYQFKHGLGQENRGGDLVSEGTITAIRHGDNFLVDVKFAPKFGGRYVRSTDTKTLRSHNVAAGTVILGPMNKDIYRYDTLSSLMGLPLSQEDRDWVAPVGPVPVAALSQFKGQLPATIAAPQYEVAARQEKVDDAWCHVVTSNDPQTIWYRYWVDPKCDFAVRRRETLTGVYSVLNRANFRDWKVSGETWFPEVVVVEDFRIVPEKLPMGQVELTSVRQFYVSKAEIGKLPARSAEVQLVPGMLVQDTIHNKVETIPGKPDAQFLGTLRAARRELDEYMKEKSQPGEIPRPR